MDSGLSWADQWDDHPDPPPPSAAAASENDKKKNKDGSKGNKIGKSILNFKWVKDIRKKSQKE